MMALPGRDKTMKEKQKMILADKIVDLRKKSGLSQEELADKLNVSRQAISKWEGAQSVPDMGRIIQLSELFGVSTDYLLKDNLEKEDAVQTDEADSPVRTIGMEEANRFLDAKETNARRVALAVMLCVLSPVALILLGGAQSKGLLKWTEMQAGGAGLLVLILLIGAAVAVFVNCNLRISSFEYLEKEPVDTLYGVEGMVKDRKEKFRPVYTKLMTIGVVLCVAAVIPLFLAMMFKDEGSCLHIAAIAAILLLAAVGVMLIVRVSVIWGSYQMLLEEGSYSRKEKENEKKYGFIGGIYWCLVTAGFLAWSFTTKDWNRTWIVWPVAGVAYGAIYGIIRALRR